MWAFVVCPPHLAVGTATSLDERALAEVSCHDSSEALLTVVLSVSEVSLSDLMKAYVTCDYFDVFLSSPTGVVGQLVHGMFLAYMPGYETMGLNCDTDLGDLCSANEVSNLTICNAFLGKSIRSEACCRTCTGKGVTDQLHFGSGMNISASEAKHMAQFLEGLGYNISTEAGGDVCSWQVVLCLATTGRYDLILDHLGLSGVL